MSCLLTAGCGGDKGVGPGTSQPKIAFVSNRDGNYEIYVINVDGTGLTRLTHNRGVDISPYVGTMKLDKRDNRLLSEAGLILSKNTTRRKRANRKEATWPFGR